MTGTEMGGECVFVCLFHAYKILSNPPEQHFSPKYLLSMFLACNRNVSTFVHCSHDFIGDYTTSYRELARGQSQFNVYEVSVAPESIGDFSNLDITIALCYCCCFLSIERINVFLVSKVMVNVMIDYFSVMERCCCQIANVLDKF